MKNETEIVCEVENLFERLGISFTIPMLEKVEAVVKNEAQLVKVLNSVYSLEKVIFDRIGNSEPSLPGQIKEGEKQNLPDNKILIKIDNTLYVALISDFWEDETCGSCDLSKDECSRKCDVYGGCTSNNWAAIKKYNEEGEVNNAGII